MEGLLITNTFSSFITKFNFDSNIRKREMGEVGVVRGGWRALLPPALGLIEER